MPEQTINLSNFIYEKLNKKNLNIENPLASAAVHYLLIKNIVTIFGTDEFLSEEVSTMILEETKEKSKIRYAIIVLEHGGIKYSIKVTNDPCITLVSPSTIPFFEINIGTHAIKNKVMHQIEEETILEEQEIQSFAKKYHYQKTNFKQTGCQKVAFSLQSTYFSRHNLEQFELINEGKIEEESVYLLERIFNNLKKNNIREIPYGENELENLVEIFACLEQECTKESYKRARKISLD